MATNSTTGTIVDRTIHLTFQIKPTSTPSTQNSLTSNNKATCSSQIEFLHRINGTSIIQQTTTLLRLSARTYATSTTIFHRFYHRKSLLEFDVWSIAMASVLLGCKIEEEVRRVSEIILVFVHVYRRMRFAIDYYDEDDSKTNQTIKGFETAVCSVLEKKSLTQEERRNLLRYVQPLPRLGPVYKEFEEELMNHENEILRALGFSLQWIPESHPHNFLLYFMRVLDLVQLDDNEGRNEGMKSGTDTDIAQIAWNYCNDSCRIDLCVRYGAELIVSILVFMTTTLRIDSLISFKPFVFINIQGMCCNILSVSTSK